MQLLMRIISGGVASGKTTRLKQLFGAMVFTLCGVPRMEDEYEVS